jgi:glycosyltransferase involved in cell wall biosynthesis
MGERTELRGVAVTLVLATSTGGTGRHVKALVAGLVDRGAEVVVAGPASADALFGFAATGARFEPVEIPTGVHPADVTAVGRLRRLLARADVCHAHGLRAGLLAGLAGLAGRGRRPPLVVTWHNAVLGSPARRRAYGLLERFVARRADVTLAASSDLLARARVCGARSVLLGPVAAPSRRPARGDGAVRADLLAAGRPLVLAVGRLHPQKRFDVLVEAAGRWPVPPGAAGRPVTVIAGDGPLRTPLEHAVRRAGVDVRLLGHRDDVADLLAAADVVVVTSDWEARALLVQEALTAGRPLVATAVGGLPELVGDAALLVPPGDPAALAAAVGRVLADPAFAAELGRRGRERAAGWPTGDDAVELVAGVYRQLLGDRT